MNKQRRAFIKKFASQLMEVSEELRNIAEEEEDYFDKMPESLQTSERGRKTTYNAFCFDDWSSDLMEIAENLEAYK